MELVNPARGFLAPMGQLFVPMRQPAVVAMKTRYRGHLSSRQYAFRPSACWGESCRFVFPIQLKNSVRLENCNSQVAATVVPFRRLNLYARSRNHRRPATDRIALQQTRRNNCVGKVDLDQIQEALLLIDLPTGAPGLRSPDPPVSASGPGQPHPPDTPVRGHAGAAHNHSMVALHIRGCTRMQTESRGQIVQTTDQIALYPAENILSPQTSEHKTYLRFRVLKVFWTGEFNRLRQT
jgi:hypothetical protein